MKLKQINHFKYKFLKLKLIKSKFYKSLVKNQTVSQYNKILEQIEVRFKKNLQIIYEYHINNKQILFIGFPSVFDKTIIKKTQHLFIDDSIWVNGILSNRISIFKYLNFKRLKHVKSKNNYFYKLDNLFKLKNKPDLIVFFDQNANKNILNDVAKTRIPVIIFNTDKLDSKLTYPILKNHNVNRLLFKNICFLCFYSIFKKSLSKKINKN